MKSAEDKTGKSFAFEVATPDATYYMHADSEKQKDEWIGAIGRCVGRPRSGWDTLLTRTVLVPSTQRYCALLERLHGRRRLRRRGGLGSRRGAGVGARPCMGGPAPLFSSAHSPTHPPRCAELGSPESVY